jgi:hypothetical protein
MEEMSTSTSRSGLRGCRAPWTPRSSRVGKRTGIPLPTPRPRTSLSRGRLVDQVQPISCSALPRWRVSFSTCATSHFAALLARSGWLASVFALSMTFRARTRAEVARWSYAWVLETGRRSRWGASKSCLSTSTGSSGPRPISAALTPTLIPWRCLFSRKAQTDQSHAGRRPPFSAFGIRRTTYVFGSGLYDHTRAPRRQATACGQRLVSIRALRLRGVVRTRSRK